ncbi:tRNA (guanosine(37)-N1)-methyltransferase TrmD [Anaerobranca gottschalkii]|uniref:tRNA (guanine-N(1)-)-methyltransferase n=1 Tax=Anaerobranca gottschalkii DSM 13577 TaxID=1120990 RepID=A0A1I0BG18_9FIRM|nr:tRNA (guanosine(37)-N1)-methyltransferase TrmD [Anaerobranca gottschalkii]SET05739.1 tRNA (guanine37-N1)-methyltransferase [Anaerobranca gottschalkii DSM 13577]
MKIDILSIFPEMFSGPLDTSIIKRAQENGIVHIAIHNIRDYSKNKHKKVDDYPYGGGAGMVMKPEPIFDALECIGYRQESEIILLTPQGEQFTQHIAEELAQKEHLIFICGHYEGIDYRVYEYFKPREISIGDYVLTGGELPAMVIIDAVVRLLPGSIGKEESHKNDSFQNGLLEHPHYTRPKEYRGMQVPPVLLSGNHGEIEKWRLEKSIEITKKKRPDLFKKYQEKNNVNY